MSQRNPRLLAPTWPVVAAFGVLLCLTCRSAQAQGDGASSLDRLGLLALSVAVPLLPLLTGAGLYLRTRSLIAATGLTALLFGAWGAWDFSRTSVDGALSGALFGLGLDGVGGGLLGLAGGGYLRVVLAETRRLGKTRTAVAQAVGWAFAALAFVALVATGGSDKVALGLYIALLALALGVSATTGSFGGVVATMALALIAMVHGLWGAALLSGVHDDGQAYLAIVYVPPALAPVVATAALGAWLGRSFRAGPSGEGRTA